MAGSHPDLTALMPVRTYTPRYLADAINSLVEQTSPRWRLVVIDDGADRLGEFFAAHPDDRIRIVPNEGSGFAAAVNTGLRAATTEFVALLFADDLWEPEAVEVLDRYVRAHPDVDVFHSGRRFVDADLTPVSGVYEARAHVDRNDFPSGSPVKHLLCVRRSLALSVGGVDARVLIGTDDWDLPWCIADRGGRFMAVDACLYVFRDHRDHHRMTTHIPRSQQVRSLRRMLRKHGVDRVRIRRAIATAKRGYLRQCLYRSRFDRWLKQHFKHDAQRGWREPYVPVESE